LIAGLKFGELPISMGERRATLSSVAVFVVISLVWGAGSARTDNMCHLGGFVTGLLIGLPLGAFARNHKLYQVATLVVTALVLSAAGNELVQTNDKGTELYRARLAASRQDYPKAIRIMEKYTAAQSDDEQAWLLLGNLYVVRDEKDKAIAAFEHALKVNPNSEDAQGALQVLRGEGAPRK
jgi:hypothetical protein